MNSEDQKYCVIVPVFNGENSIEELTNQIVDAFENSDYSLNEIILVDDASKDQSWNKIKQIKSRHNLVRGVKLRKNFGQHNATCAGIITSNSDWIITIDDDIETSPNDILKLIETQKKEESEVTYGKFKRANRSPLKKVFKFFYEVVSKLVGGETKVNGSSFRLIKSEVAKSIAKNATNFVFLDEAIFWHTSSISFVTVPHYKSRRKQSHYSLKDLFKLGGDVVMYSSLLPLKAIKTFGFLSSFVMLCIGVFFVIKHTFFNVPVQGFTALIVTIAFSTGIIIFILGIIGEYLGKLFRNSNNSPVYSIEKEI
jgi:glycosyltransferase involved in cell wall biosynthesis